MPLSSSSHMVLTLALHVVDGESTAVFWPFGGKIQIVSTLAKDQIVVHETDIDG